MPQPDPRLRVPAEHMEAGRFEQAKTALLRYIASEPGDAIANGMLAFVLSKQGDPQRAAFYLERGLEAQPDNVDLLNNLANAQLALGNTGAALAACSRVVAMRPDHLSSALTMQAILNASGKLDEAEALCRRFLDLHPGHPAVSANYCAVLRNAGRAEEAVPLMRSVVSRHPTDPLAASALALTLNYVSNAAPSAVFEAHASYGRLLDAASPPIPTPAWPPLKPGRRLRVGLVSPDLRTHPVAYFIEPWLEHRDPSLADVLLYSTAATGSEDAVTHRLRGLAQAWTHIPAALSSAAAADRIRKDRVDILIDLAGHTSGNRLPVFHQRAAPVQVTYLGYANTTGVRAIDYRIVDAHTDPVGAEALAVEKLWRLDPCFLCYRPPANAPPAGARGQNAAVVFGSFNSIQKLSSATVQLWSRVVNAVPGSRLLLKNDVFACDGVRAHTKARFAAAGLDGGRLDLLPRSPTLAEHLAVYGQIDIALDPFPYHGTTTTCEALFMGVPVVSLAGATHASRVGASLLHAAGLAEFATTTPDAFVETAKALAADPGRRARLRTSLRGQLVASPLCDGPAFARRFDAALDGMWRCACANATT